MVTVPEVIIYNAINSLLGLVRRNYNEKIDKTDSLLYKIFDQIKLERYGFFDQIVQLAITTEDNPKHIIVSSAYDPSRQVYPSLHLSLPAETSTSINSIGLGTGDRPVSIEGDQYREQFSRHYHATYHLIIVSDNKNEVIVLYHLMKALLTACINHFELSCLHNVKYGGQDLRFDERVPPGIFMRAVTIDFDYENIVPSPILEDLSKCLVNVNVEFRTNG